MFLAPLFRSGKVPLALLLLEMLSLIILLLLLWDRFSVGKIGKGQFLVILGKTDLKSSSTKIIIGIYSNGELIEEYNSAFVGPKYLDKK